MWPDVDWKSKVIVSPYLFRIPIKNTHKKTLLGSILFLVEDRHVFLENATIVLFFCLFLKQNWAFEEQSYENLHDQAVKSKAKSIPLCPGCQQFQLHRRPCEDQDAGASHEHLCLPESESGIRAA